MKSWRAYGYPRLERYRADDFSVLVFVRLRRFVLYRGEAHSLH